MRGGIQREGEGGKAEAMPEVKAKVEVEEEDEDEATLVDHVVNHGLTLREAGLSV